jgi:Mannosylglycerate hydrolase MGH1-like glycoside hydrolase domain
VRTTATKSALLGVTIAASLAVSSAKAAHPYLSNLHATKDSPIYTTYAAAMQRSEFTLDVGYHMVFYDSSRGIEFENQKGGSWSIAFARLKQGEPPRYVFGLPNLYRQPVITASYSDIVTYYYYPFKDLRVDVTFLVYSSHVAIQEFMLRNLSRSELEIEAIPFLSMERGTSYSVRRGGDGSSVAFTYIDPPDGWTVDHDIPHVDTVANLFVSGFCPDSVSTAASGVPWAGRGSSADSAGTIALFKRIELAPNGTARFRIVRAVGRPRSGFNKIFLSAKKTFGLNPGSFLRADEELYGKVPIFHFSNPDDEMMYWSAFSLMRQCMLPPEGNLRHNYYVFSREPVWGWGHGGQVFHESLSMLAYVYMDPQGAMNSQRVYMESQHADGYINYRTGPYLNETIPYNGQLTTSAPWFSWENWEIYKVTGDREFLRQAYASGKKLFAFWEKNRDTQHDGLFEWGGHAVLESVRDDQVSVWDQVGWPANFEGPDLNSMLVMEARSLSKMAKTLGMTDESEAWERKSESIAALINKYMWDDSTGFYYNVNKLNHTFTFKTADDLKRKEIIGFLPLWAGIVGKDQAARLVKAMTDTAEFWREYGVPSLAANDSYYNPRGYWNGPVWVEWEYLLECGLLRYGYRSVAKDLVGKVASNVIARLKKDHYFWEFYDPDAQWAGYHKTYIWAGLVSKMLMDITK